MATLCVAILLLSAISPAFQSPGRDSGVFIYTGWRMQQGEKLYSELWDHKPPLIHAIQFAGLWLGRGSLWGIWLLQVAFIAGAFHLASLSLATFLKRRLAWLMSAVSMIALYSVLTGGNSTETYALLPQMAILYLLLKHKGEFNLGSSLALGLLIGIAFNLRQNLIGVGLAACLVFFLWKPVVNSIKSLAAALAGFLAVNGLVLLPFAATGTLAQSWAATYTYNFHYARLQFGQRLAAIGDVLDLLQADAFFGIALIGWLCFLLLFTIAAGHRHADRFRDRRPGAVALGLGALLVLLAGFGDLLRGQPFLNDVGPLQIALALFGLVLVGVGLLWRSGHLATFFERRVPWPPLTTLYHPISLVLIWLPIEILLASWSGRSFLHYFIPLVPVGLLILGLAAHWFTRPGAPPLLAGLLLFLVVARPLYLWLDDLGPRQDPQLLAVSEYLRANSSPDEPVWVWGAEPVVNFYAQRRQPTRFSYLYPLFQFHRDAPAMSSQLLADITGQPPRLIVDTLDTQTPFPLRPDGAGCVLPEIHLQGSMEDVFFWICARYRYLGSVGPGQWPVYEFIDH